MLMKSFNQIIYPSLKLKAKKISFILKFIFKWLNKIHIQCCNQQIFYYLPTLRTYQNETPFFVELCFPINVGPNLGYTL